MATQARIPVVSIAFATSVLAATVAVWTVLASYIFLLGTGLLPQFHQPATFWQWWIYLPYASANAVVAFWLEASAGVAAAAMVGLLVVWLARRPAAPRVRRSLLGALLVRQRIAPVTPTRGTSGNHGDATWLPMRDALRLLRPAPTDEPYLVIGEAYRVDQDAVAGVPFNPRDRRTWGQGGKAPLLMDPCTDGPTHSLMFAGSGGLKTSTAITRLLHWTGSAIVLDPSREIGPMIREEREAMGQTVIEIGPLGAGMNVLAGINPRSPNATRRVLSAAASLCGEEPERGENAIFSDAGRNLVACLLAHMIFDDGLPPAHCTLAFFRELVTTPEADMKRLLAGIAQTTRSSTARMFASTLMGLVDDTFSGAYFNATQFTAWLFDDAVVDMLSGGAFKAGDVVDGPATVFIQVPLDVLSTTPAVARVIVDALAWAFIEADGEYHARTLMLVDEASKLGRMKGVEIVRDTGRKYGLTLHMLYLSEAELADVWGAKGVPRWFATISWRGYAGIGDRETAKGLSEDVGDYGVLATSEGDNRGSSGRSMEIGSRSKGSNTSTHEIKRRLILPAELREARADELFVIRKGGLPIRCGQAPYFRRAELVPLVKDNRFVRQAAE